MLTISSFRKVKEETWDSYKYVENGTKITSKGMCKFIHWIELERDRICLCVFVCVCVWGGGCVVHASEWEEK